MSDLDDDPRKALAAAILASQQLVITSSNIPTTRSLAESPAERILRRQERMVDRLLGHSRFGPGPKLLAELQQQVAQLQAELAQTRDALATAQSELAHELMNPNSRSALERLVIAVIAGGYGVKEETNTRRDSIAIEISDDAMEIYGMTLDPKTVRTYVYSAWAKEKKQRKPPR